MTTDGRDFTELTKRLLDGIDLSTSDAAWVIDAVMAGDVTPVRLAGFAVALRAKGETAAEVAALAERTVSHAPPVRLSRPAVDIVGTGGDGSRSVNISTMAAIVVAATGADVAKVGNRSASSSSGSADVLEALGVAVDLPPDGVERCLAELGIGFCFGPAFYPGLRHIGPARRELAVPTTFNLLGPLSNPARPDAALVGCAFAGQTKTLAEAFARRGTRALVVRGDDGLDEFTTATTSQVWVASGGTVRRHEFDPGSVGIPLSASGALRGGGPAENAAIALETLGGKRGPVRDAVLLNAAAALAAHHGFGESLATDIRRRLADAEHAIDSGAAESLLRAWAKLSSAIAGPR
ncbi:anthranilate phosphoribosyltransferase [Amycolatopsis roodepoortensis]|uniref:Anthranilate phosphoribosyltransferase n=1 Tax=Amycolatopsis roodepoortensis TaxID=700274 RepID=A0ABR9L6H8_9PSEU|nr:anthranilate phosphoribosyltransferase [Amycolatopsis roodepoortensis]MBE1576314.1 anthranilate phosphoribosyltransferase [Amycolatopsis roodepoortensis]